MAMHDRAEQEPAVTQLDRRRQRNEARRAESRRVGFRRGLLAGIGAGALAAFIAGTAYESLQTPDPGCSVVVTSGQTMDGIAGRIAGLIGQPMEQVAAAIEDTGGPVNSGGVTLMPGDRINIPAGPDCQAVIEHFPSEDVMSPMYPPYPLEPMPSGNVGSHQG